MKTENTVRPQQETLAEAPQIFRDWLKTHLPVDARIDLLLYSPPFTTLGQRLPATLLAITEDRWVLASDDVHENVHISECSFAFTLLVEVTSILLYGQFKVDYVANGQPQSCLAYFNTMVIDSYRQAVRLMLDRVSKRNETSPESSAGSVLSILNSWPIQFRNAGIASIPDNHRLLDATHWPAIHGGFGWEFAAAGALLATEKELILISQERSRWHDTAMKYGTTATYFPLIRLADFKLHPHPRFVLLDLEMHASHSGETLQIILPTQAESEVGRVLGNAMHGRSNTDGIDR